MKTEKNKRNFWVNAEIECMLSLIKEMQEKHKSTSTTLHTFLQIANRMRKLGLPNKSAAQIRRKWFQMKSAYLCYKRGNVDRLLLIPERFRVVIAHFVDREYANIEDTPESLVGTPSPSPPPTPPPQPTPPVIQQQSASLQVRSVQEVPMPTQTPVLKITAPPYAQIKPSIAINGKNTMAKSNAVISKPHTPVNEMTRKSFYQQKFGQFLTRLKLTHRIINRDFRNMQDTLMAYEQKCQALRDERLMEFVRNSAEIKLQ